MIDMEIEDKSIPIFSRGLTHGNFDMDNYNEIAIGGMADTYTDMLDVFDFNPGQGWSNTFSVNDNSVCYALTPGYFGSDNVLDIGVMSFLTSVSRCHHRDGL